MPDEAYERYLASHPGLNPSATEADYKLMAADYGKVYDAFLPGDRATPMLEVGCGQGYFVYYLKCHGFTNVVGVDVSPQQADYGRQFGLDTRAGDAQEYLAEPARFGWVSLLDVLEHIPKGRVTSLLQGIHRSLRPGGICLIQVPNMENPFNVAVRYSDFTHEGGFTSGSLTQALRVAGFTDIVVHPVGPMRQRLSKRVLRRVVSELLRRLYEIPSQPIGANLALQYSRRIFALARKA